MLFLQEFLPLNYEYFASTFTYIKLFGCESDNWETPSSLAMENMRKRPLERGRKTRGLAHASHKHFLTSTNIS